MFRVTISLIAGAAAVMTTAFFKEPVFAAPPPVKKVCKSHSHTGTAKAAGLDATRHNARQDWALEVSHHDGAIWANPRGTIFAMDCEYKGILKLKGKIYECTATARPCRWVSTQFSPSIPLPSFPVGPPLSGGAPGWETPHGDRPTFRSPPRRMLER